MQLPVSAADTPVIRHAFAGSTELHEQCLGLPAVARALHGAFSTADSSVRIEREAYLRNLQAALDRGPEHNSTARGLIELMQAANGRELLAGAR